MAPRGTGFTSIGDYLSANQGTLAGERGTLAGMVGGELDAATGAADQVVAGIQPGTEATAAPGYADALQKQNESQADAALLGTHGGLQDLLARKYGDNASQGDFDANLLAGGPGFSAVQQRAQSLGDYLDSKAFPAAAALPPTPPDGSGPPPEPPGPPGDVAMPPQTSGEAGPAGVRRPVTPAGGGVSTTDNPDRPPKRKTQEQ